MRILIVILYVFLSFVGGMYTSHKVSKEREAIILEQWKSQIDTLRSACNEDFIVHIDGKEYLCMPTTMVEIEPIPETNQQQNPSIIFENRTWVL